MSNTRSLRKPLPFLFLVTLLVSGWVWPQSNLRPPGKLRVTANHRYLEREDGAAFLYLGDTAWELFHRLSREEADSYLENRARKGFTVIQAVVLSELEGLTVGNAYNDPPLIDSDPAQPNEAYFRHVDYIVNRAGQLGLYIGMLPTWGSYWKIEGGKSIFTESKAKAFGRFLGTRYQDKPIIWILGGDNNPTEPAERAVLEAMAAGLKEGDGGAHLITFHPRGPGRSADFFHAAAWLDFNMFQSSHAARDHDNGLFAELDHKLEPAKPTLDGEPRYENLTVGFYNANADPRARFDAADVRQAAYWSLLAGACGHTYGNSSVWQMWAPGRRPVIWADVPWSEALDHPGAYQMGYVRKLFDSRPFQKLAPYQQMLLDAPKSGGAKVRAARATDRSFAFIYSPQGRAFTVDQSVIKGNRMKEIWYDPRYGVAHHLHTGNTKAVQTYKPPTSGPNCDWLLILEDEAEHFPLPGPGR